MNKKIIYPTIVKLNKLLCEEMDSCPSCPAYDNIKCVCMLETIKRRVLIA